MRLSNITIFRTVEVFFGRDVLRVSSAAKGFSKSNRMNSWETQNVKKKNPNEGTLPRKNMNLPYSVRLYWASFWQPTVHVQQNIFEKILQKLVASIFTLILAPFTSKVINYSRRSESLNIRKNSKSATFSFDYGDLSIYYKT